MSLEGTVKVPGIGAVPKKGAVYGTIAIVVVGGGIWWYRRTHGTSSPAATTPVGGTVTDPAGNVCSAVNPATGFCPGTAEDLAAGQGSAYNTSGLGVGGLAGYYYGTGGAVQQTPPGPGNFADNAEWSQYVISYLVQTLNARPGPLGDALGRYLEGQAVTGTQRTLIEEAIAIGGRPPQAGAGGYPPSIRLEHGHKPKPKPKPDDDRVTVPAVTGDRYEQAAADLKAADLTPLTGPRQPGADYIVIAQNPRARKRVNPETAVHLTLRQKAGAGK